MNSKPKGWYLPAEALDDDTAIAANAIIERAKQCGHVDIQMEVDGLNKSFHGDWIKDLVPVQMDPRDVPIPEAALALPLHEQRVVVEHQMLQNNLDALIRFVNSQKFLTLDLGSRELMTLQVEAMRTFAQVLKLRIARFYGALSGQQFQD